MDHGGKRKGAGRKPRLAPRKVLTIRLEPDDAGTFKRLCKAQGLSQSKLLTTWIRESGRCAVDPSSNARLIAAAPDMLAILEEILPDIECRCGEAYTGRGLHESNSLCHLVDEVKAIIAKAKGEEVDHE